MGQRTSSYRFGEMSLDVATRVLAKGSERIAIQPKVFDALVYLIERRTRVVAKEELRAALWPPHISDAVLPTCLKALRRALGDDGDAQRFVRTVHGRGYQFIAEVEEARSEAAAPLTESTMSPSAPSIDLPALVAGKELLGSLQQVLDAALDRRGSIALLSGEAGIGKSRMAWELTQYARERDVPTIWARCHQGEGAPPFWPWAQLARKALRGRAAEQLQGKLGAWAGDLVAIAPGLGSMLGTAPSPTTRSLDHARFRIFDSACRFLAEAAKARGLLLVFDNMQWCDGDSLAMLQFIADEIRSMRMLVVVCHRPLAPMHPVAARLAGILERQATRHFQLSGLRPPEIATYMAATAGRAVTPEVTAAIFRATGGNPFFVGELARALGEPGDARDDADFVGSLPLTARLAASVNARLQLLGDDARELLSVAAAVGAEASTSLLAHASSLTAERAAVALDEALVEQLLEPGDEAREYRFRSELVRAAVYARLGEAEKIRRHSAIAAAMEHLRALGGPELVSEIAHHLALAGDRSRAAQFSVLSAERAIALRAFEDAARHFERALALHGEAADPSVTADLELRLGETVAAIGEPKRAREILLRVADRALAMKRPDLAARAGIAMAGRYERPVLPDEALRRVLERAAHDLGDAGDPRLLSLCTARLSCLAPNVDSLGLRQELSAKALALAERAADHESLAVALGVRDMALFGPDHLAERGAIADRLARLCDESGDRELGLRAHICRFGLAMASGAPGDVHRHLRAIDELARELRRPIDRFLAAWLRASLAFCAGRFDEGDELMVSTLSTVAQMAGAGSELVCAAQQMLAAASRGRWREVDAGVELFLDYFPWAARVRGAVRAAAASELGNVDQARALLDRLGARGFADIERDEHWFLILVCLSIAATNVSHQERARELFVLLEPYRDRFAYHDMLRMHMGSVSLHTGALCRVLGQLDEAERHLEAALAAHELHEAAPLQVVTQLERARLAIARGDRAAAKQRAEACAALAERLGSTHYRQRAVAILEKLA